MRTWSLSNGKGLSSIDPVLFLYTHNAAGSQLAEGILRDRSRRAVEVYSTSTEPVGMHPAAARALQEVGIDIRSPRSEP